MRVGVAGGLPDTGQTQRKSRPHLVEQTGRAAGQGLFKGVGVDSCRAEGGHQQERHTDGG